MYQDDNEALHQLAVSATEEADRLRRENAAMREAVGRASGAPQLGAAMLAPRLIYTPLDLRTLPLEDRARLARHFVRPFPVWAAVILNIVTFGLFSLIHLGLVHDQLPEASPDDPSAGKAIGFSFIPWFNLYWIFFNALRLCDRLSLQFRLRGLPDRAPRGLVLAACIFTVIPYVNFAFGIPFLWTIAAGRLQACVNQVAALDANSWDASVIGAPALSSAAATGYAAELGALASGRTRA